MAGSSGLVHCSGMNRTRIKWIVKYEKGRIIEEITEKAAFHSMPDFDGS